MRINIVGGTGKMGQVHAPIFREAGHEVIISGRNSKISYEAAAKKADLTIISVPIEATEDIIRKVAPYCRAITDFTSVKTLPLEWMLRYSPKDSEVAGLHPLYGEIGSINGEAIIYCKTERTGRKCKNLISALANAGAKIYETNPKTHDFTMAFTQLLRTRLFEAFYLTLAKAMKPLGLNARDLYRYLSPPPTRVVMDLTARQCNEENDAMYANMKRFNPYAEEAEKLFEKIFAADISKAPKKIREFFGSELIPAQARAAELIRKSKP